MLAIRTTAALTATIHIVDNRPALLGGQRPELFCQHILHLRPHGGIRLAQLPEALAHGIGIIGLSREQSSEPSARLANRNPLLPRFRKSLAEGAADNLSFLVRQGALDPADQSLLVASRTAGGRARLALTQTAANQHADEERIHDQ
jgi:hypothetical protein